MGLATGIINHYFSQSGHFLKRFEPLSSLAIPIYLVQQVDFQRWSASSALIGGFLFNDIAYHLIEDNPYQGEKPPFFFLVNLIHQCQQIIGVALLVNALVEGFKTGSWKKAMIHIALQTPRIATSNLPSSNINPLIKVPKFLVEVKRKGSEDSSLEMNYRKEETQAILDVIGSDQPQHNVVLIGNEEEETLELVQDLAEQWRKTSPLAGSNVYSINPSNLKTLLEKRSIGPVIQFLEKTNGILFITNIQKHTQSYSLDGLTLDFNFSNFLETPKLKLLLSESLRGYEKLKEFNPIFNKFYYDHTVAPIPDEAQKVIFEQAQARYRSPALSENLREELLNILGGPSSLRDQYALLGRVVSIMQQRDCDQATALTLIKDRILAKKDKRYLLPRGLIELPNTQKKAICLKRESEILRIIISLYNKTGKNNVCLVGEAGCGKTQLVNHISSLIKQAEYPEFKGYVVLSFSISTIMSGATYIGEWQGRLKGMLDHCKNRGKVILFIDELHLAIGSGKSKGNEAMDIAQMMKEYITDPNFRVIGATTPEEYRNYIKTDPAFMDRFKVIPILPLEKEQKLQVLKAHSKSLSASGEPMSEKDLKSLLETTNSLRTVMGRVGDAHAYMEFMKTKDSTKALEWASK